MKSNTYYISRSDYRRLQDRAYRAQQAGHYEVCGVAVVKNRLIRLVFIKNEANEPYTFTIGNKALKNFRACVGKNEKIFSTFHSHPLAEAVPSSGDIKKGFYYRRELIYDVCGKQVRLWRKINKKEVKELKIKVLWR